MNRCDKTIGWADWTWNPITGCKHGCPYCYARKIAERFRGTKAFPNGFDVTWHPERLEYPHWRQVKGKVFVCSMSDPFGEWVEPLWIDALMDVMSTGAGAPTYFMLTKRPENIYRKLYEVTEQNPLRELGEGDYLPNVWLGCTLTGAPGEHNPVSEMHELKRIGWNTFVSIEPLLGEIPPGRYAGWAKWIIVGAQTQPDVEPKREWVDSILGTAKEHKIPVFIKGNMERYGYRPGPRCWR